MREADLNNTNPSGNFPSDDDKFLLELKAILAEDEPLPQKEEKTPLEEKAQQRRSRKQAQPRNRKKALFYALIALFSGIFLFCAVFLIQYFLERDRDDQKYGDLGDIVASIQGRPTDPSATVGPTGTVILPEYLPIYEMNNDTVGWIKIEGTHINYPVMQTKDSPDYYLNRNFDKQQSRLGAIYVREACDVFKPSDNVVIYGHFISSGQQMFTHLHKYINKSFWKQNPYVTFDTLYEHHTYQVFAVFKTTANSGAGYPYHRFNDALDQADFNNYISTVKNLSFYNTGITPQYGDKLLTLSTCEYTQDNGRLVVVAVQVS